LNLSDIPELEYDEVSWRLYRINGWENSRDGHYRIYDSGQGGSMVRYWSRTEYASRRPVVAFALRNFSERMLKATIANMVESIGS
jgi:hypothetical protein